jgi:uncharacterized protein
VSRPSEGIGGPPLLVNVVELRRLPGSRRHVATTVELDGLGLEATSVAVDGPVEIEIELEAIFGGITAKGRIAVPWCGRCRRCLERVTGRVDAEVDELFEPAADDGETYPILDDRIDLAPLVRENALLALPLAPLCRDDCPGPDPDGFPVRMPREDDDAAAPDPRWAALDALFDRVLDPDGTVLDPDGTG